MEDVTNAKHQMNMNSYSVLLFECDDDDDDLRSMEMINAKLIANRKMSPDPSTEHYLNLDLESIKRSRIPISCQKSVNTNTEMKGNENEESENQHESYDNDEIKVKTFDDLIKCLQESDPQDVLNFFEGFLHHTNEDDKEDEGGLKITEIFDDEMDENSHTQNTVDTEMKDDHPTQALKCDDNKTNDTTNNLQLVKYQDEKVSTGLAKLHEEKNCSIPVLKVLNRPLKTTWYETDWMLIFSIHAPDAQDYEIRVRHQILVFEAKMRDEYYAFVLHFLGNVCPDRTSHEVRGTNVIVRLVKQSFGIWPRLLNDNNTNYSWLMYDFNVMDFDERIMMERFLPAAVHHNTQDQHDCNDESSDDSHGSDHDDEERYT